MCSLAGGRIVESAIDVGSGVVGSLGLADVVMRVGLVVFGLPMAALGP